MRTMVAGVLGAVGNNGKGVCGVAWRVQMMACKCLDSGSGSDSTVIACIDYALANGAKIINASFDSPTPSLALSNAIVAARDAGVIWVASAGNNTYNVEVNPSYPTCYGIENVVSVAYTTRTDALGGFSNYGATHVALAAPGDQIYTTFAASDTYYWPPNGLNLAGTSFRLNLRKALRNPIIAALDVPNAETALKLAAIANRARRRRVQDRQGTVRRRRAGHRAPRSRHRRGVFLDLKFHDIPNTVAKAVAAAVRLDVQMLTIHTSGGSEMMRAAEKSAQDTAKSLKLARAARARRDRADQHGQQRTG
jgi:hypothetical protein